MAIRNPSQRVGVFVDVQNLYYSARNIYNARVNFNEILEASVGDRQLIRAIAYVIRADMPEEHTFFDALDKAGFEVKSKDLQTFYGGYQKGDWDVGIAIDIIKMLNKLDVIILCCGDGDFMPLLEYARAHGQLIEVCAFGKSTSGKIKEFVDNFIDMDQDPKRFLLPMKSRGLGRIFGKGEIKESTNGESTRSESPRSQQSKAKGEDRSEE